MQILAGVVAILLSGVSGYALGFIFGWPGIILAALVGVSIGIGCTTLFSWFD